MSDELAATEVPSKGIMDDAHLHSPTTGGQVSSASTQQPVRYATDEAVKLASKKVFRLHSRLLAELAK